MMNSTNPDETKRRRWLIPVLAGIFILALLLATTYSNWRIRSGFRRGQDIMDAIHADGAAGIVARQEPFIDVNGQWYVQQRLMTIGNNAPVQTVLGFRVVFTLPQPDGSVTLLEIVINTSPLVPEQMSLANTWELVTLRPDGSGECEYAFFEIPRRLRAAPRPLTTADWTVTPITAITFTGDEVTYTPFADEDATETLPTPPAFLPMGLWAQAAQRVSLTDRDALFNALVAQPNRSQRFFTRLEELAITPLDAKQLAEVPGAASGAYMAQADSGRAPTVTYFDADGRILERHFEHMTEQRVPSAPNDLYIAAVVRLVAQELFPPETPKPEAPEAPQDQ